MKESGVKGNFFQQKIDNILEMVRYRAKLISYNRL